VGAEASSGTPSPALSARSGSTTSPFAVPQRSDLLELLASQLCELGIDHSGVVDELGKSVSLF